MIYFLQPVDGGPIKIGCSADVDVRRKQLEAHYGRPLAVLATIDGDRETEREIHSRFSHLRLGRTEQFRPAADLMGFIGKPLLVDPNPDATEAMNSVAMKTVPVRLTEEAIQWARIASGYTGESMSEYVSRIIAEHAKTDADKLHAELTKASKAKEGGPK